MSKSAAPIAINKAIEDVLRQDRGRLIAGLASRLGDLPLAEDALQDALISAMSHWGRSGLPHAPIAWLMKVGLNKGIDRIRKGKSETKKVEGLLPLQVTERDALEDEAIPDERLRLILACCHPMLEQKSRVALTLRVVCHLTTREIAAAFLDSDVTIGQRISRAKAKLKEAGIAFEIPDQDIWPARLEAVLSTIYLIYTVGYVSEDESDRDLCREAIFLARLLDHLRPQDAEIEGTLALVLLTEARRKARIGPDGATVAPQAQDRSLWAKDMIMEGQAILARAMERDRPGPYQLKAAIADCHMCEPTPDWRQISLLYGALWGHEPTPVVALNWTVVMAELGETKLALEKIEALEPDLRDFQPFYAAYASLLEKSGRGQEARKMYAKAIDMAQSRANQKFLENKLRQLQG